MKRTLFSISCTVAAALLCGNATTQAGVMLPNLRKIKQMARDQAASSSKSSKGSKAGASKKGRNRRGGGGGGSPAVGGATYSASINLGIDHGSSIGTTTKDNPDILTTVGGGGVLVGPPLQVITTGGVSTGITTTDPTSGTFWLSSNDSPVNRNQGWFEPEIRLSGFSPELTFRWEEEFARRVAISLNETVNSQLIEVYSGITLIVTGSIVGTLKLNGTLNPGSRIPGVLTTGNIITTGSGTLAFDIGSSDGQLDQLRVNGSLLLGSGTGLNVNLTNPASVPGGDLYLIFNDGTDPISGTFAGLPEGSLYTLGSQQYTISYLGNADGGTVGNDLVFRPVPEPTAAGLSLLAACMGLAARRRK